MEDRLRLAAQSTQRFLCPGQTRPIEREVHLSRLAAFDPACLSCPQRHDTEGLMPLVLAARAEIERRASAGWQWTAEGPLTSARGHVEAAFPRQFAFALADVFWSERCERPSVHLAADGSRLSLELMAETGRALELAGCDVFEVGASSAPCLATGIAQAGASGGLWIGNASGRPHELALSVFGRGGLPWSAPGRLSEIQARVDAGAVRPRRGGGSLRRFDSAAGYRSLFSGVFHGLRALEFVLHTSSRSLAAYLQSLARETALRLTRPSELQSLAELAEGDPLEAQWAAVSREVVLSGGHFGFWTDGAGERCQIVDERGQIVPPDHLAALLSAAVDAREGEPRSAIQALKGATREHCGGRSLDHPASSVLTDGQGRYWFAGQAAPDALAVLCALLTLLSRSDRPLSEVLDAAAPAR